MGHVFFYRNRPDSRELLKDLEIKTCNLQVQVLGEQHTNLQTEKIYLYLTKQLLVAQLQEKVIIVATDEKY